MDDLSTSAAESAPLPEANAPAAAYSPDMGAPTPATEAGATSDTSPHEGAGDQSKPEGEKPDKPRQKAR